MEASVVFTRVRFRPVTSRPLCHRPPSPTFISFSPQFANLSSIFIYYAQREEPSTEDPIALDHRNCSCFGHQCCEDEAEGP
ncbi:hypothetical protein K1719_029439 [Acacia pycnantha]|nr:hypothetical protein K1719_029439 [Acacia pycnantha]